MSEFESNNEYVKECLEPVVRHIATYKNESIYNSINGNNFSINKLTSAATNLMNKLSSLKGIISSSLDKFNSQNQHKNTEQSKLNYHLLDIGKKQEALVNSLGTSMLGVYTSTQSALTYVYNFFEGALVMLTILIVGLVITGGLLLLLSSSFYGLGLAFLGSFFLSYLAPPMFIYATVLFSLGVACLVTAFAFFCIFLAVVIIMLIYAGFLKEVFGIRVNARKTSTPATPM
jgi:hypothetical protein